MKTATALIIAAFVTAAQAQSLHVGMTFNMSLPTGEFQQTITKTGDYDIEEGYDPGKGLQAYIAFPMSKAFSFRAGLGWMDAKGTHTSDQLTTVDLFHRSIIGSTEMMAFLGDAKEHRGAYIIAGATVATITNERTVDDWFNSYRTVARKTKTGGTVGFGVALNSMLTFETAYHAFQESRDENGKDTAPLSYIRIGIGLVF
jgi:opacity protein-like surface antigen